MTYLDQLLSLRAAAIERRKAEVPLERLRDAARGRLDVRDFAGALRSGVPAIVAEFKRASPSAGTIAASADPAEVAAAYERGGAAAISVLTEPDRFNGGFDDLRAARGAATLPTLCKDFIVDAYQVWEAAAKGADAVLLIVAALDQPSLKHLLTLTNSLGIAALVEIHDAEEAARALDAGAALVGINNRNLRSFEIDVETALRLRSRLPENMTVVAESGYTRADQIAACARAGIDAVLVGETLMRDGDPASAVARLRGALP